tara:strand:+ start:609 stop:908 length:300 start_codon:yes stop_codon:yes gene_type:complete
MGYYTKFELAVLSGGTIGVNYKKVVEDTIGYCPFDKETKWYDFDKDMKEISKEHPEVLFEVIGEGEEFDDIWKAYFKYGRMQMCEYRITYEDFDESLLK